MDVVLVILVTLLSLCRLLVGSLVKVKVVKSK